jgi:hypothetical protein
MISGFTINNDGSLAPVPGSPFVETGPAHAIAALEGSLIAAGADRLRVFAVDQETGSIHLTDTLGFKNVSSLASTPANDAIVATMPTGMIALRVANGKLQGAPVDMLPVGVQAPPQAVLDASGKFMYTIDGNAELMAFRVEGKSVTPLSPPSYPLPSGATFIALVAPQAQR